MEAFSSLFWYSVQIFLTFLGRMRILEKKGKTLLQITNLFQRFSLKKMKIFIERPYLQNKYFKESYRNYSLQAQITLPSRSKWQTLAYFKIFAKISNKDATTRPLGVNWVLLISTNCVILGDVIKCFKFLIENTWWFLVKKDI